MSATRKLSWSAFASLGGAVLDIVKLSVLAHSLHPEDFGVFAIALVVLGFCQLFSEGGIGNAIVSHGKIKPLEIGNLLNFVIAISFVFLLASYVFSNSIANFYELPSLASIVPLLLIALPFAASARVFQATLQKKLRIEAISKIIIVSKLCALIVAVYLSVKGEGISTLIWSTIVSHVVSCILLFFCAKNDIQFTAYINWNQLKPILSFSIYQLGEFLLNFFSKNLDVLILTKLLGAEISGTYAVLKNLLIRLGEIAMATTVRYFHPLLANNQQNKQVFINLYEKFFILSTLILVVGYSTVAFNDHLIITMILGEKFYTNGTLAVFMCLWLALRFATAPVATLWLARLKPWIGVVWNAAVLSLTPLAIMISYEEGLENIITALLGLQLFLLSTSLVITYKLLWKNQDTMVNQLFWLLKLALISSVLLVPSFLFPVSVFLKALLSVIVISLIVLYMLKNRRLFL